AVIKAKTDLWSTTDGQTWEEEKKFEFGPLPGQANGATLFWNLDRLHLAGSFKASTGDDKFVKTLSAIVYSLCPERSTWEANPVSWGWEQFGGDPFLMQSIVFNRFWFFWSLNKALVQKDADSKQAAAKIKGAPKLNVFIPS